jgi:hypothetical protein
VLVGIFAFTVFVLGAHDASAYENLPPGVTPTETPPINGGLVNSRTANTAYSVPAVKKVERSKSTTRPTRPL